VFKGTSRDALLSPYCVYRDRYGSLFPPLNKKIKKNNCDFLSHNSDFFKKSELRHIKSQLRVIKSEL